MEMHFSAVRPLLRKYAACALIGLTGAGPAAAAGAQNDFPNRAMRLIVSFPAGGNVDIAAHLIANAMGKTLGQPIVVENHAGANGSIGTTMVASA